MSAQTTQLPERVERKITNRNGDLWYEYDGEPLFDDETLARIRTRFDEMRRNEYERIATVGSGITTKTKIRTKDVESFKADLTERQQSWIDDHGERLTPFGNAYYGEILTPYKVVEINEEKPRKTVLWAQYDTGHSAFIGGPDSKKQDILLPVRIYEQWSYHTEVVEPLFDEYHELYPY